MEKMFEKIISEGKKSGKSIEEINAELKAAGANFHLNPDGGVAGWTDAEMEEGFIPAEEEPKEAWRTLDMRRRMEFAGTEQIPVSYTHLDVYKRQRQRWQGLLPAARTRQYP